MSEGDLSGAWTLGWLLGAAVVVIAATLLVVILLVARKIDALASAALDVAGRIESSTKPIWSLGVANQVVEDMVRTVRSIERRTASLADSLTGTKGGPAS